ncbi:MAG: SpoIIE family protein phosphatase [Terriglobia bacterium]
MKTALLEYGVAVAAHPGESEVGDRRLVKTWRGGALVAVVDGLGHGAEAAEVAKLAIHTLERHASEKVITLLKQCHACLQSTRGVVMSLASFNALEGTMTWLGVGNVEGLLMRADARVSPNREALLLRGGVVGGELPALRASVHPVFYGDTLIFATDGIGQDFASKINMADTPHDIAKHIMERCSKGTDDALVLAARYLGRPR